MSASGGESAALGIWISARIEASFAADSWTVIQGVRAISDTLSFSSSRGRVEFVARGRSGIAFAPMHQAASFNVSAVRQVGFAPRSAPAVQFGGG